VILTKARANARITFKEKGKNPQKKKPKGMSNLARKAQNMG